MNTQYFIDRLKEHSTWLGIVAILTAAGCNITPELEKLILTAGTCAGGILCILIKENK